MNRDEKEIIGDWEKTYKEFGRIKTSEWHELQHKTAASYQDVFQLPSTLKEIPSSPVWKAKVASEFPYKIEESQVILTSSGTMARPGMFRSKKWKTSRYILSESGYLHCFPIKQNPLPEDKPYYSICLFKPIVEVSMPEEKAHLFMMELSVRSTEKKGGKKYQISCKDEKELIFWVAAIRKKISYVKYSHIPGRTLKTFRQHRSSRPLRIDLRMLMRQ
jgi:hypothetical protein